MDNVLTHLREIWGCKADQNISEATTGLTEKMFQKHIFSVMMSGWICHYLTAEAEKMLDLEKCLFQFNHNANVQDEEDKPIMLKCIYNHINLLTRASIRKLTAELDKMMIDEHQQVVTKMIV